MAVVGPGVIVLGASIGSGEFLLGPAVFVRHGLSLLWVTGVAVFLQTIFNTELMRYTIATGEPAFTGFMRTWPSSTAWAWFYSALYFLQVGWPAWAGNAAGAIFFLFALRLAQPIVLLQLGANVAGFIFIVASLHLLYLNTRLLPRELRPPIWRRALLVVMALFYGFFFVMSVRAFI